MLTPNCHVSTAEVFSHKDLTRDTPIIKVAAVLERGGRNDCQPLVEKLYPEVKQALDWLSQFSVAQMTGTGASIFAAFDSESEALAILEKIPADIQGFVAKGVNHSSAHIQLSEDTTGV